MGPRLRAWLAPPRSADSELDRIAATLNVGVVLVLVTSGLAAMSIWLAPTHVYSMAAPVIVVGSALSSWVLARRGRIRAAARLFVGGFWLGSVSGMLGAGTLYTPAFGSFVLVILMGGLLLGGRGAAAATVLCMASALALERLYALESWQRWAGPGQIPEGVVWWLPLLAITGVLVALPLRRLQAAFDAARETEAILDVRHRALVESEARFRELFEHAPLGVSLMDLDLVVHQANEEMARLVGAPSREALVGFDVRTAEAYQQPGFAEALDAALRGRRHSVESTWKTRFGRFVRLRMHLAPVRDSAGRVSGVQSICEDISDQRELEERLHQSQKLEAVGKLAGGVAHDFNNYLTAILGNAEFLGTQLEKDDPRAEVVAEIVQSAERSASLTRQLLAFSRRQVFQPRVIDPNRLVGRTETLLRRVLGETIRLRTRRGEGVSAVRADPAQLEVVLVNLAANARDAMAEGGTLIIETANVILDGELGAQRGVPPGRYVEISVSDTGHGMDAEIQERIFEPFFTTKAEGEGTGLGLSTVHGIVSQSGGAVSVESDPGRGTTVRIDLPRVEGAERAAEPELDDLPRGHETVLLVEDEDSVRTTTRRTLERHGYRVLEAADALEALYLVESDGPRPDLVLTDVVMPRMNGLELAERLRGLLPEARVVLMSGYSENAEPAEALLQKPFTSRDLLVRVREVLDAD